MDEPVLREELLAGYERPFRRWLPVAWRVNAVPQLAAIAATIDAAAAGAELALIDGAPALLVGLAVLATLVALVWTVWTTAVAVQTIRERTASWRARDGELQRVRARRGHAGEADGEVAHDEYAVAVEDEGHLVTWRFSPLAATEDAPTGAVLLPGTPCYAAWPVDRTSFAASDTRRAAEQLADAQAGAARREAQAAAAARERLLALERQVELAGEARSTAAALRRHTGQ